MILCSKEQQRSAKTMSIWEQRTNQLRRHNLRASSEALFNELDPEERRRMSSALHLHPDMKTHLDRPLVVEAKDGDQPSRPSEAGREEAGDPRHDGHPRKHHRHRDRNGENRDGGDGWGGRHHTHHSRSRDHAADGTQAKERRGERNHNRDGGQAHRHHRHASSPEEDANDVRGGEERVHRHHHSHRPPKEGNGMIVNGSQGDRKGKVGGGEDSNGDRKARGSRMVRAQSTLDGDDYKNKNGTKGHW